VGHYSSWDQFCNRVFDDCGKSGRPLKMLYGAGGTTLILVIISVLGFSPFVFITSLLGFMITPWGMVISALLGAAALPVLKQLFSDRKLLEPVLRRMTEAKAHYESILLRYPDPASPDRIHSIDSLLKWVLYGRGQSASG
jgi:hypothetical protein